MKYILECDLTVCSVVESPELKTPEPFYVSLGLKLKDRIVLGTETRCSTVKTQRDGSSGMTK